MDSTSQHPNAYIKGGEKGIKEKYLNHKNLLPKEIWSLFNTYRKEKNQNIMKADDNQSDNPPCLFLMKQNKWKLVKIIMQRDGKKCFLRWKIIVGTIRYDWDED